MEVSPAMPQVIHLGCRQTEVRYVCNDTMNSAAGLEDVEDTTVQGLYMAHDGLILVNAGVHNWRDVLMHEILHLIFDYRGVPLDDDMQEMLAQLIGGDVVELLRRNPALVSALVADHPVPDSYVCTMLEGGLLELSPETQRREDEIRGTRRRRTPRGQHKYTTRCESGQESEDE